jgi:hypothetical protein
MSEYNRLKIDAEKLHALERAGVDNWEGYDQAMRKFYNDDDEGGE